MNRYLPIFNFTPCFLSLRCFYSFQVFFLHYYILSKRKAVDPYNVPNELIICSADYCSQCFHFLFWEGLDTLSAISAVFTNLWSPTVCRCFFSQFSFLFKTTKFKLGRVYWPPQHYKWISHPLCELLFAIFFFRVHGLDAGSYHRELVARERLTPLNPATQFISAS